MPVEGLRISWTGRGYCTARSNRVTAEGPATAPFEHQPVMLAEVVALLAASPPGVLLDGTLGGAGHAAAVLDGAPQLTLVGIDQDPVAVGAARQVLARHGTRARVVQARFDRINEVLADLGIETLAAALLDLGVSSPQLDRAERGFSYRQDGPLDMRMGGPVGLTAADVVNGWSPAALAQLFRANGEARFAGRIARSIVAARPISSTVVLADVVRTAIPAATRRTGGHPARRVFQALRIAVNEELEVLPVAVDAVIDRLAPGGRFAVIAYHSGEDRIVKQAFRDAVTGGCTCPPGLPCVCGAAPRARLLTRGAQRPSEAELEANRRSESARLRAIEKLPSTGGTEKLASTGGTEKLASTEDQS
jgi:16S rRNA (cytosine1402-N4)-methyltransferase